MLLKFQKKRIIIYKERFRQMKNCSISLKKKYLGSHFFDAKELISEVLAK